MNAVLLILCGLPGAGKSSLSRAFVNSRRIESDAPDHSDTYDVVCFDQLYAADRRDVFDPVAWKETQREMENIVKARVAAHRRVSPHKRLVLFVDDNFHYRSQRKRFFHIADEEQCGFGIIYVKASVSACRSRNATRDQSSIVPETPFEKMASAFEEPDSAAFTHEANVAVLENNESALDQTGSSWVGLVSAMEAAVDRLVQESTRLWQARLAAMEAQRLLQKQQLMDKQQTADSFFHNVDLALRRWISSVLSGSHGFPFTRADSRTPPKALLARHLNDCRRSFLSQLKAGGDHSASDAMILQTVTRFEEYAVLSWNLTTLEKPT